jgi:hypothetical protein
VHIHEDSVDLVKRSDETSRYRKLQRNANVAINQISLFLPVLENFATLQTLMEAKKCFILI